MFRTFDFFYSWDVSYEPIGLGIELPGWALDSVLKIAIVFLLATTAGAAKARFAVWMGDPTPDHSGHTSLDPRAHFNMLGMGIFPVMFLILTRGHFTLGSSQVPVDIENLSDGKRALIGLFSLTIRALITILAVALLVVCKIQGFPLMICVGLQVAAAMSALLLVFRLLPVPPGDAAEVIRFFLPGPLKAVYDWIGRLGWILFIVFLVWLFSPHGQQTITWAMDGFDTLMTDFYYTLDRALR